MSASSRVWRRGCVTFPASRGAAATVFATFVLAGCAGAAIGADVSFPATPPQTPKAKSSAEPTLPPLATLANPTGHALRGEDAYGAGFYGASRAAGARRHRGADYVAEPGEIVRAPISGVVERIGFAYRGDQRYRYVELASEDQARYVRVLYVGPLVHLGAFVRAGEPIGRAQDLSARYPRGITNHVHVEMRENGALADPANLLPAAALEHAGVEA
jgi:murein DD-endopeptidase MepM/ murein hydrolase activator NlpD